MVMNMSSLASKYRPMTLQDVTDQRPIVQMLTNLCNRSELDNRNFLFIGPSGCGKAQPLDSVVWTPNGLVCFKDLYIGMKIYDGAGDPCIIDGVYPRGVLNTYKLLFSDGSSIRVAEDHLNVFQKRYQGIHDNVVLSTKQLISEFNSNLCIKYCIDTPILDSNILDYLDLDEYLEEHTEMCKIPIGIDELMAISLETWHSYSVKIKLVNILRIINSYGKYENGHIVIGQLTMQNYPLIIGKLRYFLYSVGVHIESNNTSVHLYDAGNDILNTLMTHSVHSDYICEVRADRYLVQIIPTGPEECICIHVSSIRHTYISDMYVPTHNTTIARALSRELNQGESDIIEVDAASNNGVDSVRELISLAQTYPIVGKYKVFVVDECHAFSSQAWQIWLKTLEESPAMSVFMFCTTNPERIPNTILSRTQVFKLSKLSLDGIFNRLKYIIQQEVSNGENISYTDDALWYLSQLSNGGMRDAITNLEQVLLYASDVTMDSIEAALGISSYEEYFNLLQAYARHDNAEMARLVDSAQQSGKNLVAWFSGFHQFIMQIVEYVYTHDIKSLLLPAKYEPRIQNYTPAHALICLSLSKRLVTMQSELRTSAYPRELILTYLCSNQARK